MFNLGILVTYSSSVVDGGQDQHDVIGPVFLIDSHLVFFDDQDVQVGGAVHGMIQVKQTVLMATRGGCKYWTLNTIMIL